MKFLLLCNRFRCPVAPSALRSMQAFRLLWCLAVALYGAAGFAAGTVPPNAPEPDLKIQFQILVGGKPLVGANELAAQVKYEKSLSSAQKAQLDEEFDAIVVPFQPGSTIPFIVNLKQSDGSWKNITSDPRLTVHATLEALTFAHTEKLVAQPPAGMPPILPGMVVTIYVGFLPNPREPKKFGFNEYYMKAVE